MVQLYIDKKKAVLKSGSTIKLTRENPFFSGSGDYTLEVTLPLEDCTENLRIFGAIHRAETSLLPYVGKRYDFLLLADDITVEGTALVLSESGGDLRVQLLGGRSSLNNALPEDVYIDEVDMGYFQQGRLPDPEAYHVGISLDPEHPDKIGMAQFYWYMATGEGTLAESWRNQYMYGSYGQTDGPCFPIFSPTDDALLNYEFDKPTTNDDITTHHWVPFAPQPWLMVVIEKLLSKLGYSLSVVHSEDKAWVFQVFVANSRATTKIQDTLPHWTLREFISEVENFLSCVFLVEGKHVTLRFRSDFYTDAAERVAVHNVSDEWTSEIQENEKSKTTQSGNVDYDWEEEDKQMRLPDEVWEQAELQEYDSYALLVTAANSLTAEEKSRSRFLFRNKANGYVYAHLLDATDANDNTRWKLVRVDYMPPLIRMENTRDIDIKMRVVPAHLTMNPLNSIAGGYSTGNISGTVRRTLPFPVLKTSDIVLTDTEYYSINAAINPSDEQTALEEDRGETSSGEKKDLLLVAIWDGRTTYTYTDVGQMQHTIQVPTSIAAYTPETTGLIENLNIDGDEEYLRLTNKSEGIGRELANAPQIEFRAQRIFQFTDKYKNDVTKVFIVRNRLYACLKIEYTIDEHGVQPMRTGYFYPLE